jgi:D-alanyl-D-alanine carboxypeptidase (penicillin-binding protein 5/6)
MRLVSVVMGTESEEARARETQSLLNYGFRFFETHRLYGADQALTKARVWKGDPGEITLGLSEPLYVTIPRRQYDDLQARTVIDGHIEAPVAKGQTLGRLVVELDDQPVTEVPLVAQQDAPEGGLFRVALDSVWLWFE